jgi:hypothetical protein
MTGRLVCIDRPGNILQVERAALLEVEVTLPLISGANFAHSSSTWTIDCLNLIQEGDSCHKYPLVKETFF